MLHQPVTWVGIDSAIRVLTLLGVETRLCKVEITQAVGARFAGKVEKGFRPEGYVIGGEMYVEGYDKTVKGAPMIDE